MVLEQDKAKLRNAIGHYNSLITQVFIEQPQIFEQMPEEFELVLLPIEDPEVSQFSLELINRRKSFDQSVIYASIGSKSVTFLLPTGPLEAKLMPIA